VILAALTRPAPTRELQARRRRVRVNTAAAVVGAAVLWALPYSSALAPSDLRLIALAMIYATAVMGLNLVFGLAGQVTLGPAAVFATGAYGAGLLNANWGWNPFLAIAGGIVLAGVVGLVIGVPAARVGGFYLAMITALAADTIPATVKLFPDETGGDAGLFGIQPFRLFGHDLDQFETYRLVLVVMIITAALVAAIARSAWGRWFRALNASEVGTNALGVSAYRGKLVAFVLSAIFGGLAGGMYATFQLGLDPQTFSFELSLVLFSALVIGGLGSMWGPVLGSFLYVLGPEYLLPDDWGTWSQVLYGALLIVLMIAIPNGLVEGFSSVGRLARRGIQRAPRPASAASTDAISPLLSPPDRGGENLLGALLTRARDRSGDPVVLRTVGVVRRFGGVVALDHADLEVRAGQVTALIGPNGSGKTTLLNVCCGFLRPDAGRVELDGLDVTRAPAHIRARRGIGRTFQGTVRFGGLTPVQTVMAGDTRARPSALAATLTLPRSRRHERDAAMRAEQLLVALGVGHLIGAPAGAGSLADARVVGLARALAMDPLVLVLDEPAAGLDLAEIEMLETAVMAARDAGVGVLLVEHDVAFVTRIADHVTVLDRGRVIFDGPPGAVRDDAAVGAAYFGSVVPA
jgi:ABC-type branched-subunit amino acid transport system ATPase component/ABC-type branched-subunit amino acid transport system permease subunit